MRIGALCLLGLLGCSSSTFDVGGTDAAGDASVDTGSTTDSGSTDASTDTRTDTGLDTGRDTAPDGPLCPRPKSTVTPDVTGLGCDALTLKYSTTLPEARRCACDADCSIQIAKDFCGCKVNASPANDATRSLEAMADWFAKLKCTVGCPAIPCKEPTSPAKCVFDAGGLLGLCN